MKDQPNVYKCLLLFMMIGGVFSVCVAKSTRVKQPDYAMRNSHMFSIEEVFLTDSNTQVKMCAKSSPGTSYTIDSLSYLRIGNEKFCIIDVEGVGFGSTRNKIPESGKQSFTLTFQALPKNTSSFDFIECNSPSCFNIYGILLKSNYKNYKNIIPKDLQKADYSKSEMPKFELAYGSTQVIVHLLSPVPVDTSFFSKLTVFDMLTGENIEYKASIDSTGTYRWDYQQYGSTLVQLGEQIRFFVDPGVKNELWIDLYAFSHHQPYLYTQGRLDALNRAFTNRLRFDYNNITGLYETISDMTVEQYVAFSQQILQDSTAAIESNKSLSPLAKSLYKELVKTEYAALILDVNLLRLMASYYLNKDLSKVSKASQEEILTALKRIDYKSDNGLYFTSITGYNALIYRNTQIADSLFLDNNSELKTLIQYRKIYNDWIMNIDKAPDNSVDFLGSKFYSDVFRIKKAEEIRKKAVYDSLMNNNKTVFVEKVPEVDNKDLFSSILSTYKGKIVLVDFWGVTCGPCMHSIRSIEPLKKTELKSADLEFVYLTCSTWSSLDKWYEVINHIKGHHYFLTVEQWNAIMAQFKHGESVPFYIIVQKDGSVTPLENQSPEDIKAVLLKNINNK